MSSSSEPTALMYIDDSNIFENAKQYSGSAKKKGYPDKVQDTLCRLRMPITDMISIARGNKRLLFPCKVYTSKEGLDFGKPADVDVKVFKRSGWTNKEKQVDTALTAEAVEDIITQRDRAGLDRTLILFSGDGDFIPLVKTAIKYNYKVEVWAFDLNCNSELKSLPPPNSFHPLEDIFDDITCTKDEYDKDDAQIPEGSLVASLPSNVLGLEPENVLKEVIKTCSEVTFKLPFQGKYLDLKDGDDTEKQKHILLVVAAKPPFQKCSRCDQTCQNCYPFGAPNYEKLLSRNRARNKPMEIQLYQKDLQYTVGIQYYKTFIDGYWTNEKEQRRNAKRLPKENCLNSFWCSYGKDCKNEHDDEEETYFKRQKNPESYKTTTCRDFAILGDCERGDFCFFSHGNNDTECLPCNPNPKKPNVKRHLISACPQQPIRNAWELPKENCLHSFWCLEGKDCKNQHDRGEEKYFRKQKNPWSYKTIPCRDEFQGVGNCERTYRCFFAHSYIDTECLFCNPDRTKPNVKRHLYSACPQNKFQIPI